jgi:putative FmdB family regulatory protein
MTYEYACKCCNHTFEEEQSIKDEPLSTCPKCQVTGVLRRLISSGNFILKGGGWAADNYSGKSS